MNRFITPIFAVPRVVFFPNVSLPFYIADPEYNKMIADSLESGNPVTVSMAVPIKLPNGRVQFAPREIATMGTPHLLESIHEGTIKILMRGISRVKIIRVIQHLPYLIAEVETLPDKEEIILYENKITKLEHVFKSWIEQSLVAPEERNLFLNQTATLPEILDYLSMLLIQDPEVKQLLLECDSPIEKVYILDALLTKNPFLVQNPQNIAAIKYFEFIDKISKMAS